MAFSIELFIHHWCASEMRTCGEVHLSVFMSICMSAPNLSEGTEVINGSSKALLTHFHPKQKMVQPDPINSLITVIDNLILSRT